MLSYLVELIFTLFEFDQEIKKPRYPFFDGITFQDGSTWNGWVTDANFVYGFMETSARGLIFVSAAISSWYGIKMNIFFVCITLEILDGIDYWLFYNHTWFDTGIEFNYIKIGVVFFYAWKEYTASSSQKLR